jgi:hypothetical protein
MKRSLLFTAFVLAFGAGALAQQIAPMIAKPEDQAVIKPMVEAEKKAKQALDAKTMTLPEYQTWKDASARTLREAYRLQAKAQLSSLEYRPELNDKGDLIFSPIPKP